MRTIRWVMIAVVAGVFAMPVWAARKEQPKKDKLHPVLQEIADEHAAAMKDPAVTVTGAVRSSSDSRGTSTTYALTKDDGGRVILYKSGGRDGLLFKYGDGCNPELYNNKNVAVSGRLSKDPKHKSWMIFIEKVKILGDAPAVEAPAK